MATTETRSPRFVDIDSWPTAEAVEAMLEGQLSAVASLVGQADAIARACDAAAGRLMRGRGRLVYSGAGTSGRIAAQDGVELKPTYGWPDQRLAFAIAGGMEALANSAEGAEDDVEQAKLDIAALKLSPHDVLVGVAASGRTPYTLATIEAAKAHGALTIGMANNRGAPLLQACDYPILADTGSELVAGSTRMKAGTAQKAALNLLSTAIMLRLGRVYRGMMVDMIISNKKLYGRARAMVETITGCAPDVAEAAVEEAGGHIKTAALIALGSSLEDARALLHHSSGNLRVALSRRGTGDVEP
jgi:N-acetylmuramic acid 6-phosphate etherase